MLALVLSCCGLRHRPHEQPDERSPLIPHADDTPTQVPSPPAWPRSPPSSPQPRVVDQQRLKERLCSVVRSKEGLMVNVNAQFPFNLHNQEYSSSRSSRNVSGGTLAGSRAASPSPARHLHKAPSNTSFRPDGEDVLHSLPLAVNAPILNARLVKSARSARGRSPHSADPSSRTTASELPPDEQHTSLHTSTLEQATYPPVNPETPPHHPEDFTIHDAGAVARSWGD